MGSPVSLIGSETGSGEEGSLRVLGLWPCCLWMLVDVRVEYSLYSGGLCEWLLFPSVLFRCSVTREFPFAEVPSNGRNILFRPLSSGLGPTQAEVA